MRKIKLFTYLILTIGLVAHLWMAHENGKDSLEETLMMFAIYSLPFLMHFICVESIEKVGYVLVSTFFAVIFTMFWIICYWKLGGDNGFWPLLFGFPVNLFIATINLFRVSVYNIKN